MMSKQAITSSFHGVTLFASPSLTQLCVASRSFSRLLSSTQFLSGSLRVARLCQPLPCFQLYPTSHSHTLLHQIFPNFPKLSPASQNLTKLYQTLHSSTELHPAPPSFTSQGTPVRTTAPTDQQLQSVQNHNNVGRSHADLSTAHCQTTAWTRQVSAAEGS